ncbi:HNH endonuclease [Paenactinomyces guangxiensis]|uniref:HNH endonuclease n=1 Tax=Paenactinomyces guangxiensis TaxID=1490290 RepID=A0A7W1WUL6_9BACL|nr:HNH endonuclease [Paenactinomyces guangxiensis]MBA4496312.1 HNH endonuclease [Paenactinomyces guangxiensis]MBH8593458.1 HNH endonuclease [Paenactinomyces guangxiensis]
MKNRYIIADKILKVYAHRKGEEFEFLFDTADLDLLLNLKNTLRVNQDGYLVHQFQKDGRNHTQFIHRILMGEPDGLLVDHRNGNRQDNRRCNLRVATHQENQRNRRGSHAASGYRNVYYMKSRDKYQVRLKINGKMKNFGYYKDVEEANKVAYEARAKYFGEFSGNIA